MSCAATPPDVTIRVEGNSPHGAGVAGGCAATCNDVRMPSRDWRVAGADPSSRPREAKPPAIRVLS